MRFFSLVNYGKKSYIYHMMVGLQKRKRTQFEIFGKKIRSEIRNSTTTHHLRQLSPLQFHSHGCDAFWHGKTYPIQVFMHDLCVMFGVSKVILSGLITSPSRIWHNVVKCKNKSKESSAEWSV